MDNNSSCLIIGGGITGLIAAKVLQDNQISATVLDKGRGIGGRLATRRIATNELPGIFDYGAPHFQVTNSKFQQLVDSWLGLGLVKEWSRGFYGSEGFHPSDKPFYCGVESIRSIAKYLAQDLDIHTDTRIVKIEWQSDRWAIISERGNCFAADTLLITSPVPQSLDLLDNSNIAIPADVRNRLDRVSYHRCLTVLALLDKPSEIPHPGGLWLNEEPLSWISCEQKKGISPACAATVRATKAYSLANWEKNRDEVAKELLSAAAPWLRATPLSYQIHGWKFSQPDVHYEQSYAAFTAPGTVVLAGDAFSQQRNVEGAALSGLAAAKYISSVTRDRSNK